MKLCKRYWVAAIAKTDVVGSGTFIAQFYESKKACLREIKAKFRPSDFEVMPVKVFADYPIRFPRRNP